MQPSCDTRAVKILKHLRGRIPATIDRASVDALERLPSSQLASLRTPADSNRVIADAQLRDWLASNPLPAPRARVSGPLFHGTLVFVQAVFQQPGLPPSSVSLADVQTAVNYATLAVIPIQRYAWQYGPNSVAVSPTPITFPAAVAGPTFTMAEFESWVDQCAQMARDAGIDSPCIVILHNRDLANAPQFAGQRNSFHSVTRGRTPYCYCLVFGENLSVADNNHSANGRTTEKVYAHMLSHEIAEMVVDPFVDGTNPEVCDACAGNCSNDLYDLFDQNAVFLGGTADTAAATGFAFFINAIVSADVALDANACVTGGADPTSACVYPPPFVTGELLSYGDAGTPGNVSNPMLVGFGGWLDFRFLFAGANAAGADRIYAVDAGGRLLSYGDAATLGNVSNPVVVGLGGWQPFKFLFGAANLGGENRIYAVDSNGRLLSYGDAGTPGNVSDPIVVGFGGWRDFRFLFGGRNGAGENRIYAVDDDGRLLSYGDAGTPGNVSDPIVVGLGGWRDFRFLFSGRNLAGANRIYAVNQDGELLSYGDAGTPGNVSSPDTVGFGGWLAFKFLFGGRNAAVQDRIYAVVN
jgi:hypothetical protein